MKHIRFFSFLLIFLLLGGCSGLSAEELYCLPEANQDYYDLQTALSAVLSEGYSYLAPASGARREPVQLVDLDHDGADEAAAFLRSTQDGAVVVYIFSKSGEIYETADVIECAGSTIGAVEYVDLDHSGDLELLITSQVSESVTQALQIFRFQDGSAEALLTVPCGKYALVDLDQNDTLEILCLTDSGTDNPAAVEYYTLDNVQSSEPELHLSGSYSGIVNIQEGTLSDGCSAVLVTVDCGDQIATDVFIQQDGALLALDAGDILKTDRIRGSILPVDINGDSCLEFPKATALRPDAQGVVHWAVSWYAVDSHGNGNEVLMTYHSLSDHWYLELPDVWKDQVTVIEDSDANSITFCRVTEKGEVGEEILTIYSLDGSDQREYSDNMTTLYHDADRILTVSIPKTASSWAGHITVAEVSERFHLESEMQEKEKE